jgi:predicted transcriptional regulator
MIETQKTTQKPLAVETVAQRWGEATAAGFIPVPNTLVRAQASLKLSGNEVVVILNILLHWWHADRLPHPRTTAISKRSGLARRTVQRAINGLIKKGLMARAHGPKGERQYDLTGLRVALAEHARTDVWTKRKTMSAMRLGRGEGFQNPTP